MRNLDGVKRFYEQVKIEAEFDYAELAEEFENHDVFANPPQFHKVALPFLGDVELTLIAVNLSCPSKYLGRCKIAENEGERVFGDGKYHYNSKVSFFVKPTEIMSRAGFKPETQYGDFAGLIDLTCNQGTHSNLFGHPMEASSYDRARDSVNWYIKSPSQFCTQNLPEIIKYHLKRFFPEELHEYPFEDDEIVTVHTQDVNKIGGYKTTSTGGEAREVFYQRANQIIDSERGNANVCGFVTNGTIRWVIPAFGKDYVAFNA